jgi:transposase
LLSTRTRTPTIGDDPAGLAALRGLLATHGDDADQPIPIPIAIETSRGLLVAMLRATGRPIHAINPMAVARYRDRHSVSGKKSDDFDALTLANILRTDANAHRVLPTDSELAQAIAVLARAQQDAVWDRGQAGNKLRSHLREYYPGFLAAFDDAEKFTTTVAWPASSGSDHGSGPSAAIADRWTSQALSERLRP